MRGRRNSSVRPAYGRVTRTAHALAAGALIVASGIASACSVDAGWDGDPSGGGKADDATARELSILLSQPEPQVRRILSDGVDALGGLSRSSTGILNVDGTNISENVILVFDGTFHTLERESYPVAVAIRPRYYPPEQSANPAGFLRVDFKTTDRVDLVDGRESEDPARTLGHVAGVFQGDVYAVDGVDAVDLVDLWRPGQYAGRSRGSAGPANVIRRTEITFTPNVAVLKLAPEGAYCPGHDAVDVTTSGTTLETVIAVDGFPPSSEIDLRATYRLPESVGRGVGGAIGDFLWDYTIGWFVEDDAVDEDLVEVTVTTDSNGYGEVQLPEFPRRPTQPTGSGEPTGLDEPGIGSEDQYPLELEVVATNGSASALVAHEVTVVRDRTRVVIDRFRLCRPENEDCQRAVRADAAANVVARRNVIEYGAEADGYFDILEMQLSDCQGGDAPQVDHVRECRHFGTEIAAEASARASAQVSFQLSVNGKVKGGRELDGAIPGWGSGELEAQLEGAFGLSVDLDARFSASRTFQTHSSRQVTYDPATTMLQQWRLVTPRVYYMEVAEYDSCGNTVGNPHKVYLSDFTQSKIVEACQPVASNRIACDIVSPTEEAIQACDELLVDGDCTPDDQASSDRDARAGDRR